MFVKKGIVSAIFAPTHIFIITLVKKMCETTLADCFHKSGYIIYVNYNIKYKQFSKKNNLIYIDNSNMNSNLKLYLNNPNSHFPNIEGYKKIYSNILMDLEV